MSDVSKTNEELRKALNVAREHFSAIAASGEIKVWEVTGEKRGIDHQAKVWAERGARLASEALAAARIPVQGEPNARVVTRSLDSDCALGVCMRGCSHLMWLCDACSSEGGWGATRDKLKKWAAEHVCPQPPAAQGEPSGDREALDNVLIDAREAGDGLSAVRNRIIAAGFSRATVPDAATRHACSDTEFHQYLVENLPEDEASRRELAAALRGAEGERDSYKQERDAATAALGRVRETLSLHNPNGRLVKEVLAALDGAPEPEWEYQWGEPGDSFIGFGNFETYDEALAEMRDQSEYSSHRVMRRRKAGPWLPVEGESNGA